MELFPVHIQVSWLRDTMPIDQHNGQYEMKVAATKYTLKIMRVRAQDFGNYSCIAENQLGKNKKIVTLTGLPRAPQFRSNAQSQWRDKYNISWTVDSYAPIEEYKFLYKMMSHNNLGFNNHLDPSMDLKDSYPSHANYVR
jgi:Immunoglobulin I-set domain